MADKKEAKTQEVIDSTKLNIYQKVNHIASEIGAIEKSGRNDFNHYNFIEQAVVVATIKPLLLKYGVAIIPSVSDQKLIEKEKGSKILVGTSYTVINTDDPEDRFVADWAGEGDDTLDKGTNKALTASQKYFYMKLFNISDKEDPDAESNDIGKVKKEQPKAVEAAVKTTAAPAKSNFTSAGITEYQYSQILALSSQLGKKVNAEELKMLSAQEAGKLYNELTAEKGKQNNG